MSIVGGAIEHLPDVKVNDLALSALCIATLLILQHMPGILSGLTKDHPNLQKALWLISVSRNAIVVVICTLTFSLRGTRSTPVKVVGKLNMCELVLRLVQLG